MHSAINPGSDAQTTPVGVRPMLMITGFLGAGKTTLLRAIVGFLTEFGYAADVILNDRENARIDQEALSDHAASVAALTGSCVCCEGLDELCGTVLKVSKSEHDLLMIELNGTADPVPLQETFTLLESQFLLQPRWQVCVLDARKFGHRNRFQELGELQLQTASHYYLSRTEEMSESELQVVRDRVKGVNPRASQATAAGLASSLAQAIRLGALPAFASGRHQGQRDRIAGVSPGFSRVPHLHDKHHLAHQFTGCNIIIPDGIAPELPIPWLEKLPDSVIRAKALMTLETDQDCRFLFERVGLEVSPNPIPVRRIGKIPCSALFIGPDLDPGEILELTREHLHPDCHFPKP